MLRRLIDWFRRSDPPKEDDIIVTSDEISYANQLIDELRSELARERDEKEFYKNLIFKKLGLIKEDIEPTTEQEVKPIRKFMTQAEAISTYKRRFEEKLKAKEETKENVG